MRKLALFAVAAAAVTALTAFSRPPVDDLVAGGLPKCGNDICMGSAETRVITKGDLLVTRPLLPGPGATSILFDGGVGISGNLTLSGKVPVLKADILDAGLIYAQGSGPISKIFPFTTAAIDFAAGTIVCEDSAGTTVGGVAVGDSCFVGMPETLTAGGTGLHHSFTCYVSAANTVKVRACAAGTADNPGSVVFKGFVISSAQ